MDSNYKKAQWIAEELNADADDVYDILLGYIIEPRELVADVDRLSQDYDNQKERFLRKT